MPAGFDNETGSDAAWRKHREDLRERFPVAFPDGDES